jgi:hypothetical protein
MTAPKLILNWQRLMCGWKQWAVIKEFLIPKGEKLTCIHKRLLRVCGEAIVGTFQ